MKRLTAAADLAVGQQSQEPMTRKFKIQAD